MTCDKWHYVKSDMGDWRGNAPQQIYNVREIKSGEVIVGGLSEKAAEIIVNEHNSLVDLLIKAENRL